MKSLKKLPFTLVEVVVATSVVAIMILGVIEFMGSQIRYMDTNKDKKYCLLKANQILNELRTYIEDSGETSGIADTLDRLHNPIPNPLLTIMPLPELNQTDYQIVLSHNIRSGAGTHVSNWKYLRTIGIAPVGVNGTRQITVKIYLGNHFKDFPANNLVDPIDVDGQEYYPQPVISLITVLPTVGDLEFESQQVFDFYNVAIENVPGWWVHMGELFPVARSALDYVDSVNDGMTIRNHWVTKLGYGRDRFYAPYMNVVKDSYQDVENAYYYPGTLPSGFSKGEYYVPTLMKGHMQSDVNDPAEPLSYINGYNPYFNSEALAIDPALIITSWDPYNPYPYALADYLNNPMRYPDMKELYDLRNYEAKRAWYHKYIDRDPEKNPGLGEISREDNTDFENVEDYFMRVGEGEEMPWALLLDEMSMNPELYRNAIFLNLHGELLPMPPTRNYSDAAFSSSGVNIKRPYTELDPAYDVGRYSYFRTVTHAEKIRYHAYNDNGASGAADETTNVATQNPFLRVYGYLTEAQNGTAWRSEGANSADGHSGVKKARLDDEEESPLTVLIRFHQSTYEDGGDNSDFMAWRDLLTSAAATMRNDRYVSFYEGGVNDLNDTYVPYGTNYLGTEFANGTINEPNEANEGWAFLNHSCDPADGNAAYFISQDGTKRKGLGVEPLGFKYAPMFFLDHSLDPNDDEFDNVFYFHQKRESKINYVVADDANPDTSDVGLNVDYIINPSSPANNILKAAGDDSGSVDKVADIRNAGQSVERETNPIGWTPHFLGVEIGTSLPAAGPVWGSSEWYALQSSGGVITSGNSISMGKMKYWDGAAYDDTTAAYHAFPRRNDLRGLGFYDTDSLMEEGGASNWHFALLGPDANHGKYEMLYLSDKNWVPLLDKLNLPNQKKAWDDTMTWELNGEVYVNVFASKSAGPINALYATLVNTGKYLITNYQDDDTISEYIMMTTIVPGDSSGQAFMPTPGMILDGKVITSVVAELANNDPMVVSAFLNDTWTNVRFFQVKTSAILGNHGYNNVNATLVIPKAGKCSNVTVTAGVTYEVDTYIYHPAVGMKVYNAVGGEETTIISIDSFVENSTGGDLLSPARTKFTVAQGFSGAITNLYLLAVPAVQSKPIDGNSYTGSITYPVKRGMTLYAENITQLNAYAASLTEGDSNYVRYAVVKSNGSDSSRLTDFVYKRSLSSSVEQWKQVGDRGRKLDYDAGDTHWSKIPYYDRMWAEVEYVFVHNPKQSKWVTPEVISSGGTFTGDHCIKITLHNTPMTTASQTSAVTSPVLEGLALKNGLAGGLLRAINPTNFSNDRRLYELEYVPTAVRGTHSPSGGNTDTSSNTLDLLMNDNKAKNTARWRIKVPSRAQFERTRAVSVATSKNIAVSNNTQTYFNTYLGGVQLRESLAPLTFETRMGGITSAEWSNIAGDFLNVAVGSNTSLAGTGAPSSVTIKNGYFLDVSKDIANWAMWGRIIAGTDFSYEDCRTHNNSRAFTWIVNNMADYANIIDDVNIPFSEKFQTYGDPRHMPYEDLKDNFAGTNQGYNWYFNNTDSSKNWNDYTNFGKKKNGYGSGGGPYETDIPKLFMWLREGMLNANTLWCSITGYSYYYVGHGNEIGYDSANGFSNSIPVHLKPWGTNSNGYEQSITGSIVTVRSKDGSWEARNFIGELFPEWEYNNFTASMAGGGLQTGYGSGATEYRRYDRVNSKFKEINGRNAIRRTETRGCTSLLNVEQAANQKFNHQFSNDSNYGAMVQEKIDMINDAFRIQLDPQVSANRPWIITDTGNTPHEWSDYSSWRKEALLVDKNASSANALMDMFLYRDPSNRAASALLEVHDKNPSNDRKERKRALFLINGLSQMNISGPNSISTFSVMSLLYGYLRGGSKWMNPNIYPGSGTAVTATEEPNFVRMLPKVNIISPKITFPIHDPICQIKWTIEWRRWDGKPYWGNNNDVSDPDHWKTEYAEPTPNGAIFFRVIYSEAPHSSTNDWRYVQKPEIKTSAGLTFDRLIEDNETYTDSVLDIVEIDGDEVFVDADNPGRVIPTSTSDVSPWTYRLDWDITNLKLKTAYAFRVECHRRQHTIYYIDSSDGQEKAYENDSNAVSGAKNARKYLHSHYTFQQGLMIAEDL